MIVACLVATTAKWNKQHQTLPSPDEDSLEVYDSMDGPSEEEAYLQGTQYPQYLLRLFR